MNSSSPKRPSSSSASESGICVNEGLPDTAGLGRIDAESDRWAVLAECLSFEPVLGLIGIACPVGDFCFLFAGREGVSSCKPSFTSRFRMVTVVGTALLTGFRTGESEWSLFFTVTSVSSSETRLMVSRVEGT